MIDLEKLIGKNINQVEKLLDKFDWVISNSINADKQSIVIYVSYPILYTCKGKIHKVIDLS